MFEIILLIIFSTALLICILSSVPILFALNIENTAVIIAPLIPWSIAGVIPLTLINAPTSSIFAAWYLYLIPLCCLTSGRVIKFFGKKF